MMALPRAKIQDFSPDCKFRPPLTDESGLVKIPNSFHFPALIVRGTV